MFQTARNLALDHLRARGSGRTLVDDVPQEVLQSVAAPTSSEDAAHAEQLLERPEPQPRPA